MPSILTAQISGSTSVYPFRADSLREAYQGQATRVAHGYFTRQGGGLRLHVVIENLSNHRMIQDVSVSGGQGSEILPLVQSAAHQIDKRVRPLGTTNAEAVRLWGEGLIAPNPGDRASHFELAVKADPNFGAAYLAWAQTELGRNDRAGAETAIEAARQRGALLADVDRARLDLLSATLEGNIAQRRLALVTLSRLIPTDAGIQQALADLEFQARHYAASAELYRNADRLAPSAGILNSLGYALAYVGDLAGARDALERYGKLPGQQPNALDSLGEVSFYLGQFGEAEQFFLRAHDANAALQAGRDLLKAAEARLMTGDVAGADGLFQRFVAYRRQGGDPSLELQTARWEWLAGRHKKALARLGAFAEKASGDAAALAAIQRAIWDLESGDGGDARVQTAKTREVSNPELRVLADLVRFVAESPQSLASGVIQEADRVTPQGVPLPLKNNSLAIALLLSKNSAAAVPLLKALYDQTVPSADGQVRALYAWALIESGRAAEASDLVALYPMPLEAGDPVFASLTFPRFLYLRGAVRDQQGKRDEARSNYQSYLKLVGDNATSSDDVAKARRRLQ